MPYLELLPSDKQGTHMTNFDKAQTLLSEFKQGNYLNGLGILSQVGSVTVKQGRRAALVREIGRASCRERV